jgi:hypothetical protein
MNPLNFSFFLSSAPFSSERGRPKTRFITYCPVDQNETIASRLEEAKTTPPKPRGQEAIRPDQPPAVDRV